MKELTIEQKAQRYDEAIEIAKRINNEQQAQPFNIMTRVFPELKESEDDRIRKELIVMVKLSCTNGDDADKKIAWLEKQGEQRSADTDNKFIRMRETKPKDISEFLDRLTTVEQEFLWEHIAKIRELDKGKQKSAWSEEDVQYIDDTLALLSFGCSSHSVDEVKDFLKSLKDRLQPQPKQEWSEDDEAMWAEISDLLWEGYKQSGSKFSWDDIRNWVNPKLKSLRPQKQWKPSEEQMGVIAQSIAVLKVSGYGELGDRLGDISEQLNKLKG